MLALDNQSMKKPALILVAAMMVLNVNAATAAPIYTFPVAASANTADRRTVGAN